MKGKRRVAAVILAVLALLAGGYLALCAWVDTERVLPGTTVNGVALGGMTREEAVAALSDASERQKEEAVFPVTALGERYEVALGDALTLDSAALAEEALQRSQKGLFARGIALLESLTGGYHREVLPELGEENAVHAALERSGLLEIDTTKQTSVTASDGALRITRGVTGETVDEKALTQQLISAAEAGHYGEEIACPMSDGTVEPVDWEEIEARYCAEPVNATLDPERDYAIVESAVGVTFDREQAQRALDAAAEGQTVSVDLVEIEPKVSTQALKEGLFADVLGSYTTQVGGSGGRIENVRLAAEKCDGVILLSGETFSFNDTVGEQTAETGFQKANAILNGEIIQAYGGGICQVSSTIFAAALYANLEIAERWNHTYVASYIDAGMDAAVAWGDWDLRIVNSTDYPVRLDVSDSGGTLKVELLGTQTRQRHVETETRTVGEEDGILTVDTYRKVYNQDRSQLFMEKVAESEYSTRKTY